MGSEFIVSGNGSDTDHCFDNGPWFEGKSKPAIAGHVQQQPIRHKPDGSKHLVYQPDHPRDSRQFADFKYKKDI